jgi:N-carbamoylputrescine amidase
MVIRVSGIQLGPYKGSRSDQLQGIQELCQSAVNESSPDIIVLPELISTPYFPLVEDHRWFLQAEGIPGPTSETLVSVAKRHSSYVIGSMFHKRNNRYYNSAPIISPSGSIIGIYDKTHIPRIHTGHHRGFEDFYFTPGGSLPVWDISGVRTGVLICYDRSFPESWRVLVLAGATLILVLASSSGFRSEAFVQELQIRALENGVWVVAVNKGGDEFSVDNDVPADFYGKSCVISPGGEVMEQLGRSPNSSFTYDIDTNDVLAARSRLPLLDFRRPDLYGALASPAHVKQECIAHSRD